MSRHAGGCRRGGTAPPGDHDRCRSAHPDAGAGPSTRPHPAREGPHGMRLSWQTETFDSGVADPTRRRVGATTTCSSADDERRAGQTMTDHNVRSFAAACVARTAEDNICSPPCAMHRTGWPGGIEGLAAVGFMLDPWPQGPGATGDRTRGSTWRRCAAPRDADLSRRGFDHCARPDRKCREGHPLALRSARRPASASAAGRTRHRGRPPMPRRAEPTGHRSTRSWKNAGP